MRTNGCLACDLQPCEFGRASHSSIPADAPRSSLAADIKLFATTFACGFLFMTVFLG